MTAALLRSTLASVALCSATGCAGAQSTPESSSLRTARAGFGNENALRVASGALVLGSFVFDERLRAIALANRTPALDRLAGGADVIATSGHIVPVLVTTYIVTRVIDHPSLADATLRVGLSYAAADAMEALLKPAVGRERPYNNREPLTFRPFTSAGDFHSFPSAHVVHISSLATAIAMEADRPWVTALSGLSIAYVGAQRIYRDQHWSSDVVLSAVLGVEIADKMMHKLRAATLH